MATEVDFVLELRDSLVSTSSDATPFRSETPTDLNGTIEIPPND
jgi:hypothetical protein